jgi:hypothetical protein
MPGKIMVYFRREKVEIMVYSRRGKVEEGTKKMLYSTT